MTRQRTRREIVLLAGSSLALAGCVSGDSDDTGSNDTGSTDDGMEDEDSGDMEDGESGDMDDENSSDMDDGESGEMDNEESGDMDGDDSDDPDPGAEDESDDSGNEMVEGWRGVSLEDVTTGDSYTIAEFDRPVVLHTFATWCPKCRSQQSKIDDFRSDVGDDVAFVDMTIDENDDPDDLRSHAEDNGFDWRFSVAPADMTRALVEEFGQSVAIAPQSPVIVICPDGTAQTIEKQASPSDISDVIDQNC